MTGLASADLALKRPPSIPEDMWTAVPESMRGEFVASTATMLRRGVHPAEAFGRIMDERQIARPSSARPASGMRIPRAPRLVGVPSKSTAAPVREQARAPSPLPAVPFPKPRPAPRDVAGGMGEQVRAALLAEIARDPVLAYWDPACLAPMRGLSGKAMDEAREFVLAKAEECFTEMKQRKASGDPALADWEDPDGWTYGP